MTRQQSECYEMFEVFLKLGFDAFMKSNIKRWELAVYGGRPELYPQDRKALLTLYELYHEGMMRKQPAASK